jgi:membrane-associated phospholipid phosphatase
VISLLLIGTALADTQPTGLDGLSPFELRPRPAVVSDVMVGLGGASSLGLGAALTVQDRDWRIGAGTVSAMAVTASITELTKQLGWQRRRPYTWDTNQTSFQADGYCPRPPSAYDCKSFFSGHTSMAAVSAFSAVEALRSSGQLQSHVGFAYGAAALYTVGVGSLRVAAGKHYISDVATGALVGAAVGILVPRLVYRFH